MALESDTQNLSGVQPLIDIAIYEAGREREKGFWNAIVALQTHGLANPELLDNEDYRALLDRAVNEWGEVFEVTG